MKITQEVREYAAAQESQAQAIEVQHRQAYEATPQTQIQQGMEKMSVQFKQSGSEVYHSAVKQSPAVESASLESTVLEKAEEV